MAGVYRAWDERLRVWRAAKVLLPEFARKKKLRQRFEREAHTMARLEHANLVRVVDVGTSGKLPFIVMELVPSGTLMQWVERNGPMPEPLAVDALIQVAQGLAEVHRNGVIHRDIKPHNVLINEQGICKITDFGIAQESEEGLTRAGSVMGTMGYMAPEQRNDAAGVDVRADVYGFGATLWKLVTAKPLRDLFMYTEDPSIMEGIDEGLAEVLMGCLAYSRKDRPEHMSEVIDALRAVRQSLPDIPAGTPELPLQGQVESVEATSDTFAEIQPAFSLSTDWSSSSTESEEPSIPDDKLESPKLLQALPYGLPQRMEAPPEAEPSGDKPSWLVEDDPTDEGPGGSGYEISIGSEFVSDGGFEELAPTTLYEAESQEAPVYTVEDTDTEDVPPHVGGADVPAEREATPQTPSTRSSSSEAAEPAAPANLGLMVKVGGALVFVSVLLIGGLFFWSRSVVVEARSASDVASQKFYTAMNTERNVATALVHFDTNARGLEGLYLDFEDHPREPERWERAMTFVDELEVYGEAASKQQSAQAKQIQGQVGRLTAARDAAREARHDWIDARYGFPGVLAGTIGLAPTPPFDEKAVGGP